MGSLATLAVACSISQDGIAPPRARIFLPEGGLVDGRWLYVVNSNSDLRYNNGTLAIVDLAKVAADRSQDWPVCPADSRYVPDPKAEHTCCWDFLDRSVLNCDEQSYIKADATVRVGSFGGRPRVHKTLNGLRRLLVPVRGNSSITMLHLDESDPSGPRLVCTGPAPGRCWSPGDFTQDDFAECAEEWRIDKFLPASTEFSQDSVEGLDIRLPEEPYGMAVDNVQQLLYVGHLQTGLLSLIDLAAEPSPRLVTIFGSAVPSSSSGARGITSLTSASDEQGGSPVFVTSRYRPVVTSVVALGGGTVPSCTADPETIGTSCSSSAVPDSDAKCAGARDLAVVNRQEVMDTGFPSASETRGFALSADENSGWILQRTPPAVVEIDRSPSPLSGLPLDLPTAVTEVCVNPAFMEAHQAADGLLLYVSCFDTGEIYVVSADENRIRDVIEVGRGPAGIIFDSAGADPDHGYVLGFGANNVSVVDVRVGSPTRHRVVQRIGFPSPTPRAFVP